MDQRRPELNPVVTPALTDILAVRQSGDTRDKRETLAQALSLIVEVNDLTAAVVWANVPQANIPDPLLLGNGAVGTPAYSFTGDPDTGVYDAGADILGLTAGGVFALQFKELNAGVIQVPSASVGVTANPGGGQGSAGQLNRSYNVLASVASAGDSVKLPPTFLINSIIFIKNDGANAADVFPATGDDLGAGLNTAVSIGVGESLSFIALVANATWTPLIVAGTGDVTKVGTPVDTQIGLWTGDGTIKGFSGFKYDGTNGLTIANTSTAAIFIADSAAAAGITFQDAGRPQIRNVATSATVPNIHPHKSDLDTGLGLVAFDQLLLIAGGVTGFAVTEAAAAITVTSYGPLLVPAGTLAIPTYSFTTDVDSGLYSPGADILGLVAGGISALQLKELNSGVVQAPAADITITAFATGGQGSAVALKQSYNVISVCASAGDSIKLPDVFLVNSVIYVKNDGVESCDVFPASGDNLGQGVDTAEALAAGESASYIATAANATWTPLLAAGGGVPDPLIIPTGGSAGAPKLAFGDANTGFYESADNTLKVSVGSTARFFWEGNVFGAENSQSAAMINQTPTVIVPTLVPNRADFTSGIGWGAFGEFSLVAGSLEVMTLKNVATALSIDTFGPIIMNITGGPRIQNVAATALIPNLLPNKADTNTGIGYVSDDRGALVAGGIAVAAFDELAVHPKFIIDPNDAGTGAPTLVFGSTMAEGFKGGSGTLSVMTGNNVQFRFIGGSFRGNLAGAGAIENVVASATVPSVRCNSSDVDTGLGAPTLDQISLIAGGVEGIRVTEAAAVITVDVAGELDVTGEIHTNNAAGGAILNEAASDTNPTIIAHRADPLTGLGATNAGELHLIANSIRGLTVKELNGGVLQVPAANLSITAYATGGQTNAVTMWNSYNVISVCATAGDSVKLPSAFSANSVLHVKNDGAQSCDVFPANGDDLGAGTDTAVALAAGASLSFIGTVASTTWTQLIV